MVTNNFNLSKFKVLFTEHKKTSFTETCIILIATLCFSYSLYITFKYSNQALLDNYSFRQTQTALTAYWLGKNGFSLAYETPVAGIPWSIPFEFPIYQYIVSLISKLTNFSLDSTGRVTSFLFLVLCILPAQAISKSLNLSKVVTYVFTALVFSSPLYLYWGRTFMIETAAIFFSIASIKYFIDITQSKHILMSSFLFLVFSICSILQKSTTGLPVLAALGLVYLYFSVKELIACIEKKDGLLIKLVTKRIILALVYFGLPLFIGIIWTIFTDQIKTLNSLGINLTSSSLASWNWGTFSQRFSSDLYLTVIKKRIFEQNLSGILGVFILLFPFISKTQKSVRLIVLVSVFMGLIPLFLFTNLHIVHTYYQTAIVIFLLYAISVSIGQIFDNYLNGKIIVLSLLLIMVASNLFWFSKEYLQVVKTEFNEDNSRDYVISKVLNREVQEGNSFIAFGNDWSSSFAYLSKRKSFTVPQFFHEYKKISLHPESFIDMDHLGAVVLCTNVTEPTLEDISNWAAVRNWKIGSVSGCYIAVPESEFIVTQVKTSDSTCDGKLEFHNVSDSNYGLVNIHGLTSLLNKNDISAEKIYVTLTNKDNHQVYYETLELARHFEEHSSENTKYTNLEFSRVINSSLLLGNYSVGLAKVFKSNIESCQYQNKLNINASNRKSIDIAI